MRLPPMTATRRVLDCMGLLVWVVGGGSSVLLHCLPRAPGRERNESEITKSGLRVTPLVTFFGRCRRASGPPLTPHCPEESAGSTRTRRQHDERPLPEPDPHARGTAAGQEPRPAEPGRPRALHRGRPA